MNLDYERNVCFTEATNSGLFTKKKLKRKKTSVGPIRILTIYGP